MQRLINFLVPRDISKIIYDYVIWNQIPSWRNIHRRKFKEVLTEITNMVKKLEHSRNFDCFYVGVRSGQSREKTLRRIYGFHIYCPSKQFLEEQYNEQYKWAVEEDLIFEGYLANYDDHYVGRDKHLNKEHQKNNIRGYMK